MRQQSIAKLIPLSQLESEWGRGLRPLMGNMGKMGAQSEIAYGDLEITPVSILN